MSFAGPPHRAINPFEWRDIPPFVVLIGPNGSGKTQLLELIAVSLGTPLVPEAVQHSRNASTLEVSAPVRCTLPDVQVVHKRSWWDSIGDGSSKAALKDLASRAYEEFSNPAGRGTKEWTRLAKFAAEAISKPTGKTTLEEFIEVLPPNWPMMSDDPLARRAPALFVSYREFIDLQSTKTKRPPEEIEAELAPMPWVLVDSALARARLPYRVVAPSPGAPKRLQDNSYAYQLALQHIETGQVVPPEKLSSGERVIYQLALWFFAFAHAPAGGNDRPRLLLLDEPDAHLHPALAWALLDVIHGELVSKYGVRVIMTTHSASTVALAPEESLFKMTRAGPRKCESRWKAVGELTAGYLTIGSDVKCVFVEDVDDKAFFNAVETVLKAPRSGPALLDPSRSIVFFAASEINRGKKRSTSGGRDKVKDLVDDMEGNKVAVIVDLDAGNLAEGRLHVLGRYEIENYLLDPLFLFALLLEEDKAPAVAGLKLTVNDGVLLADRSDEVLQSIADVMLREMRNAHPSPSTDQGRVEVVYSNGRCVKLDRWFLTSPLVPMIQNLKNRFPSLPYDNAWLITQYKRIQLVPMELVHILQKIQAA